MTGTLFTRPAADGRALAIAVLAFFLTTLLASAGQLRFPILLDAGVSPPVATDLRAELGGQAIEVFELVRQEGSVVVWLDAPLMGPRGLETAVRSLAGEADRLVRLGPVDVVLADPDPTVLVRSCRDSKMLEEALRQAGQEAVAVGELAWLRQRYLASSEHRVPGAAEAREAAAREIRLLERQRSNLALWLAEEKHEPPGTLLLAMDGFDLEPRRFYLEAAGESVPERFPPDPRQNLLARSLAATGWTVVALSFGRRQPELTDPGAALSVLADATAGRVVRRPKDLTAALDRLDRRWLATANIGSPTATDLPTHLAVHSRRPTSGLSAPSWGTTGSAAEILAGVGAGQRAPGLDFASAGSGRSVLRLLPPAAGSLVGTHRIETVTGRRRIGRVVFLLDGESVSEDHEPPFSVEIDLGPDPRARELAAVAYSRTGRELGTDTLVLNSELDEFRVEIAELRLEPTGQALVRGDVRTPRERTLESVEIFWDDRKIASLPEPPFEATFTPVENDPGSYARIVARWDDGSTREDARLYESAPAADRIDVQLVELLAVVTRGRSAPAVLGPEDFTVVQGGEIQAIRQFASADDLPLTLGLAIDTSESMNPWMSGAREAAANFLTGALGADDRAFLVHFDTAPRLAQEPSDLDSVVQRLGGLRSRGDTVLYDGVLFSLLQFDPLAGSRRALVILTDGKDEGSRFGPRDCLREAADRGVPIYFIALGQPPDPLRDPRSMGLARLAHRTGGRLFHLSSPDDLGPIYARILEELEGQYYLAYSTDQSLSAKELEDLEVRVRGDDLEVRAVAVSRQPGG